jgi:N-acetylglucosaminyl-diphospho-decaprenol L-rhamnosyltransferase
MTTIAVVMVTFRARDTVIEALNALARANEELRDADQTLAVVVDNASGDDTATRVRQQFPWVELIESPENVGFAAGCNIGIRRAQRADLVALLNPDVEVRADFLRTLAALEWPADLAARGPMIFDEQGKIEQSARGFPRASTALFGRTSLLARARPASPLLRRDLLADPDAGAREVDWVSGACLIAPAERFHSIGLLDEGYFMYWEDADWCRRASTMGYRIVYDPVLLVTHYQGSSSRYRPATVTIAFHRSALRYWRKHVARSFASTAFAALALSARCALKLIALTFRRAASRAASGGRRP